jgi:phosphatidylinositol alpha-1,6-mannosyltransferase
VTRPCLAAITLDSKGGGVATVSRLLWQVFRDRWQDNCRLFTLVDGTGGEVRSLESSTVARFGFGTELARAQALRQCPWVFYSHLHVARVQQFVPSPMRRPYAIFLHGIEAWRNLPPGMRRVLDGAALRVANSHFTARRVAEAHPEVGPIAVCPLALPADGTRSVGSLTADDSGIGPHAVILVARMISAERYKGHDELLEAWPAVVARVPDAQLVFVGSGDDADRLSAKAATLGVGSAVTLTGFVSTERLRALYTRAAMFAMPSRGEGFGLVYLEAMSYGLPCIGSIHDAAGEIIDDGMTGVLVDQTDTRELSDSIVQLLQDEGMRRRMGAEGQRRLEREFSYEQFSRRLLQQIEETLGDPARSLASLSGAAH